LTAKGKPEEDGLDTVTYSFLVGAGATAATDLWAIARRRIFGVPPPNFALIGRWLIQLVRGRVRSAPIPTLPPVRGEHTLGWVAHYLIGVMFAALLPLVWGGDWVRRPTLVPALIVGMVTVAAPFLILQPAMGAGIAASRSPDPAAARLQSVVTHFVFGLGLYLSARLVGLMPGF
jgi:hypothetical protein